jgi:DNA-binding MarR family transcriptional regulator
MAPSADNLQSKKYSGQLLQLLTDAQTTMGWLFENQARHLGLNRPQWRVLSGLHGNDGLTQSELSEKISIARSPLGKIVDRLEALGYVERRDDPDDRRIHRLFLTPAVQPLVQPVQEIIADLEKAALVDLPEDADFMTQLALVRARLVKLTETARAA